MDSELAVLAIGGNSLIKDKEHRSLPDQYETVKETCTHVADLIEDGFRTVITHGNGPQVGFILRRAELATHELHTVPLDICGADTQGAIGYMIQMALHNEFKKRGIAKSAVTVVTQTIVDKNDPSFSDPTKPIGSFMPEEEALTNKKEYGWEIVEDAGRGFRRVVPSPIPTDILELDAIKSLIDRGYVVVAAGGGGIPVIKDETGNLHGVEAVIDKDRATSLLATNLGADIFIISTSIDCVYLNFGEENQRSLRRVTLPEIKRYLGEGHFKPGSMKPKIESIIRFLENGGKRAIVTSPENIRGGIKGDSGTTITAK